MKDIAEAIDVLCDALKNDPDYYRSWQANIAMAYYDEHLRNLGKDGLPLTSVVHKISNNAAKNFLDMLINTGKKSNG